MKQGDKFTLAGVYRMDLNPAWRWWKFWAPRRIKSDELIDFTVIRTR